MKKNVVFTIVLVLVVALATCLMTVGCAEEIDFGSSLSPTSIGRISVSDKDDTSLTSTPASVTGSVTESTVSSDDNSQTQTSQSTEEDQSASSSAQDSRDPDTPYYN